MLSACRAAKIFQNPRLHLPADERGTAAVIIIIIESLAFKIYQKKKKRKRIHGENLLDKIIIEARAARKFGSKINLWRIKKSVAVVKL